MKLINFDYYIKKMIVNIFMKTALYLSIHQILLFWALRGHQKPT